MTVVEEKIVLLVICGVFVLGPVLWGLYMFLHEREHRQRIRLIEAAGAI